MKCRSMSLSYSACSEYARTVTMQGLAHTAITTAEKCTSLRMFVKITEARNVGQGYWVLITKLSICHFKSFLVQLLDGGLDDNVLIKLIISSIYVIIIYFWSKC